MTTDTAPAPEVAPELDELEVLRIQNKRMADELAAYAADRARARELLDEADKEDELYETAAEEAKRHKKARDLAKESLRALVAGEVNVRIDFSAPAENAGPGTPLSEQVTLDPVLGTYGLWQWGLTVDDLNASEVVAMACREGEYARRKVKPISILGDVPHIPRLIHQYADGSGFADLLPLLEIEAWNAHHAEKYGSAVRDLGDEVPDIEARRKTGGEFNGYMVKAGKRKLVVGPISDAIRVVFVQIPGSPGEAEYEAKALLPDAVKSAEVLSFPPRQMGDRLAARLAEYVPTTEGHHEGFVTALAGDLRVDPNEIVDAVKADPDRFEIVLTEANGESADAVRLLVTPTAELFQ